MALTNTPQSFGAAARTLHWLTALLILTAIPLGLYARSLPYDTAAALAAKAQAFSLHKTVGVAAFFTALVRILWALTQPRPVAIHPDRTWENRAADLVHWMLYISLLAVPLSGWVRHAATTGFAPILWPLGQDLPLVPKSASVELLAATAHWLFGKLLIASILLHVAGALKHAAIDRDAVLARMLRGTPAPARLTAPRHGRGPLVAAVMIYAAGAGLAVALTSRAEAPPAATATAAPVPARGWTVETGNLTFSVRQMGATVAGTFPNWQAAISFDPATGTGSADVTIDTTTLTLGSITVQAKEAAYFDTANHPTARFTATIRPVDGAFVAEGTLTLRGVTVPVILPFTLAMQGDVAQVAGALSLDRRDFGMGAGQSDDESVGFNVGVEVALTARAPAS